MSFIMSVSWGLNDKNLGLAPFIYHNNRLHFEHASDFDRLSVRVAYTLIQVSDGTLILRRRASEERCVAGDLVLTQPGDRIRVTSGTRLHLVAFDLFYRKRKVSKKRGCPGAIIPRDARPSPALEEIFNFDMEARVDEQFAASGTDLLVSCADNYWRNPISHGETSMRIALWLLRYVRYMHEGIGRRSPIGLVNNVDEIIRTRLSDGVRVVDIARTLGVSRAYLTNMYTIGAGVGPGEAIENLQRERAKRLLADTKLPIRRIAARLGFKSPSAFGRFFKRHLAQSPGEWRRAYAMKRHDESL